MTIAKKCDRCEKFYEEYNTKKDRDNINGIVTANIDFDGSYFSNKIIDLCPKCKDEFIEWLNLNKCNKTEQENFMVYDFRSKRVDGIDLTVSESKIFELLIKYNRNTCKQKKDNGNYRYI